MSKIKITQWEMNKIRIFAKKYADGYMKLLFFDIQTFFEDQYGYIPSFLDGL